LKIEVWDQDPFFKDDLIGYTKIDIEDRYFDSKWRELKDKPVERRILYHPDLEGPQGWVTLWVEVFEKSARFNYKKWDISPPPTIELEMRLIVWETENTPVGDVEGMSDYYVVAFVDSDKRQSTDVHYRCEEGANASFNWRIVLPLTVPRDNSKINIQLMDNDLLSYNDYLSSNQLEIGKILKYVYDLDIPLKFDKNFYETLDDNYRKNLDIEFRDQEKDKFWLQLYKQGSVRNFNNFRMDQKKAAQFVCH
jgi:hypothetical protein